MESIFALPPPAIRSAEAQSQSLNAKSSARENSATAFTQSTPPVSPKDKPLTSSPRHKRTASGAVKLATEVASTTAPTNSAYALPPPPSRARKIIQMKPKSTSTNNSSPASDASYLPPTSATPAPHATPKSTAGASTNSKRKQPSATSAAGRKIARKTAHSIIERRRRSKMNEEFGVLKDMIPACEGVEMHKLAILQAGIEYVRYLEGCVAQLKAENEHKRQTESSRMHLDHQAEEENYDDDDDDDDNEEDDEEEEAVDDLPEPTPPAKIRTNRHNVAAANEWTLRDSRKSSLASLSSSSYPSPHIPSQSQGATDEQGGPQRKRPVLPVGTSSFAASPSQVSVLSNYASATPTPTLLSPAFNSIHFSPDLARTQTNSSVGKSTGSGSALASTSASWTTVNTNSSTSNPSPSMQPLPSPKAAMHLPLPPSHPATLHLPAPYNAVQRERDSKSPAALSDASGTAEATASAALMMLTNEWRGGGREHGGTSARGNPSAGAGARISDDGKDRGKGMSVMDLLSS